MATEVRTLGRVQGPFGILAAVPRPENKSRARYYSEALLDRATVVTPVMRFRERLTAWRESGAEHDAPDGLPLPPGKLRVRVVGTADPDAFMHSSAHTADIIQTALAGSGVELGGSVLDFGCGCGRIARRWAGLGLDLHGCDADEPAVRWCRENLPFMEARVNALEPPSPYESEQFDVIYAISILTHLTERVAHAWMAEWARMLKPGGTLLFSVHGDAYRHHLSKKALPRYDAGEMVVKGARLEGLNACVANHPYRYVTERLLAGYELLTFRPYPSATFAQDVYVARPAP
jgi:2-polyprenyl-3-methyl-5-hydroxy-6-metoxy-1,4-benzoquinol methylase